MAEKYLALDLDDPRAEEIAEIMANKSAKKIVGALAEKQMSEGDLSKILGMPLNSVEYNLKKLVGVGLVEKTSSFFWSSRGKKIPVYKVAERKIVISPRTAGFKGVVPAILITAAGALGLNWILNQASSSMNNVPNVAVPIAERALSAASSGNGANLISQATTSPNVALWFMLGGLVAIFILLLWNWRKIWK